MTINIATSPNCLQLTGDVRVAAHFGAVHSVVPICLPGNGHHPHVDVRFCGGVRLELDPATIVELVKRFPEALAQLDLIPDVHDAVEVE